MPLTIVVEAGQFVKREAVRAWGSVGESHQLAQRALYTEVDPEGPSECGPGKDGLSLSRPRRGYV